MQVCALQGTYVAILARGGAQNHSVPFRHARQAVLAHSGVVVMVHPSLRRLALASPTIILLLGTAVTSLVDQSTVAWAVERAQRNITHRLGAVRSS